MDLAAVERALDALEAEGARLFDAPSCDCVRTLITRAEELGGRDNPDSAALHGIFAEAGLFPKAVMARLVW